MKRGILVVVGLSLVACGAGDNTSSTSVDGSWSPYGPTSTSAPTTTESVSATAGTVSTTTVPPNESMRGKRYCEVLLLGPSDEGISVTVWNSYPMGDCPDDQWRELDGAAIAAERGSALALLNGPRYWLMDLVDRAATDVTSTTYGRIEMNQYATITISDPSSLGQRYTPQTVDRQSTFVFHTGQTVFQLRADDGRVFVMQSWSQQVDPTLAESDLASLADRLSLPAGWTYESVELTSDLVVGASAQPAQVLQDDLSNSYSLVD